MKKTTFRMTSSLAGFTLEEALLTNGESAPSLSLPRSAVRKLIMAGMAYVNGRRISSPGHKLRGSEVIDLYWDPAQMRAVATTAEDRKPLRVLYEDEAIICFDKPAQMPTQPTVDAKRLNLFDAARAQLQQAVAEPPYLGMHHRLDRDTSGVVLFTRDTKYNEFISHQFSDHLCSKLYVALVHGRIPRQQGRLESYLGSLGKVGPKKMQKFGSLKSGGKKAITDFTVLAAGNDFSLVEVSIKTGRTHQIRVHFSEMGHPVVGDTLYGSPAALYQKYGRHLLHAHALTIEHPITHNLVRIESPVPDVFRNLIKK